MEWIYYIIGYDWNDDINGECKLGMNGILVKTCKYINGNENKINKNNTGGCNTFDEAKASNNKKV